MVDKNRRRERAAKADKSAYRNEPAKELATVTPDQAFFFYREIGQPLGVSSKSLAEFASMVKEVDPSAVRFHLERGDFENWFKKMGDQSLASQVAALRGKNISPDELRRMVSSMVRARVDQLRVLANPK